MDVDPPRVPLVVHIGDMMERRGLESNETQTLVVVEQERDIGLECRCSLSHIGTMGCQRRCWGKGYRSMGNS